MNAKRIAKQIMAETAGKFEIGATVWALNAARITWRASTVVDRGKKTDIVFLDGLGAGFDKDLRPRDPSKGGEDRPPL